VTSRLQLLDSLDAVLDMLALLPERASEGARGKQYAEFAHERAEGLLRTADDEGNRRRFEVRLRLAMHLAPAAAIDYTSSNTTQRWRLVHEYLVGVYGRAAIASEPLAREIAKVLDSWQSARHDVSKYRSYLLHRDGGWCQNCRFRFSDVVVARERDAYKPYHSSPEELTSPEVDHILAISGLGTNELENLQLLCRLCNGGKDDGLGVPTRLEAQYAGRAVDLVPISHRARLLYYVIDRDRRTCTRCAREDRELTIRPILTAGGYVRSNLQAVCIRCAD
jgi:5-methylcytosine-specific restriction endonuclease McrA